MEPDTYLTHLRDDARRLAVAARQAGLTTRVPSCPDWDVAALVEHVGAVYHHKIACMRLGRRPAEGEWARQPEPGGDVADWCLAALDELVGELVARGVAAPSYTWFPADQTVGFWYRRMAQETLVHRVDAELAADRVPQLDADLATDGVDEMLQVFLAGPWWEEEPVPDATGRTVAVRADGAPVWRVTMEPAAVRVEGADGPAAATVAGAPADLLLWVWGRPPLGEVATTGDATAVQELRDRLTLVSD